jgi:hypothetical protein
MSSSNNGYNLYHVAKLQDDGGNWLAYKGRTVHAIKARNLNRHLLGTARKPYEYRPKDLNTPGSPLLLEDRTTVATPKQIEENEKELDAYDQKEAQVIQQIVSTVNDRILLLIEELDSPTAVQVWKLVCGEYESKSELVVADHRRRLQDMRGTRVAWCQSRGHRLCRHNSRLHARVLPFCSINHYHLFPYRQG